MDLLMLARAFIGTRDLAVLPPEWVRLYEDAARWTARQGYVLHTGAAPGADQRAAEAALAKGGWAHLFLLFAGFAHDWLTDLVRKPRGGEWDLTIYSSAKHFEWAKAVRDHHPVYRRGGGLSERDFRFHARNAGIVLGTSAVIALPSRKPGGGGTGQGMRLAEAWGIPLYDLTQEADRERLRAEMDETL